MKIWKWYCIISFESFFIIIFFKNHILKKVCRIFYWHILFIMWWVLLWHSHICIQHNLINFPSSNSPYPPLLSLAYPLPLPHGIPSTFTTSLFSFCPLASIYEKKHITLVFLSLAYFLSRSIHFPTNGIILFFIMAE